MPSPGDNDRPGLDVQLTVTFADRQVKVTFRSVLCSARQATVSKDVVKYVAGKLLPEIPNQI